MLGNLFYCLGGNIYFRLEVLERFSSYFALLVTDKIDVLVGFFTRKYKVDLFGSWHSNGSLNSAAYCTNFGEAYQPLSVLPFPQQILKFNRCELTREVFLCFLSAFYNRLELFFLRYIIEHLL